MDNPLRLVFVNLASQPCGPAASSVVLSAAVQRRLSTKIKCSYLDAIMGQDELDSLLWRVLSEKPDIVCFSLYSWNVVAAETLMCALAAMLPTIKIALGGPATSLLSPEIPAAAWRSTSRLGEISLVDWLGDLVGLAPQGTEDPMQCRPYLDRSDPYVRDHPVKEMIVYDAARGCPFSCTYCFDGQPDRQVLHRPPDVVFAEMSYLASLGYSVIDVNDNNANLNSELFTTYMTVARESPTTVVHTEVRAELFTRDQAAEAASIPNFQIFMGLQTTTSSEAETVGRHNQLANMRRLLLDWIPLRSRQAVVGVEIIFGLPGQSIDSFGSTFDFAASLCPNKISLYHYRRFPWDQSDKESIQLVLPRELGLPIGQTATMSVDDLVWCRCYKKVFYTLQAIGQWTTVVNAILSERGQSAFEFYCDILTKCESVWSFDAIVSAATAVSYQRLGPRLGKILGEELANGVQLTKTGSTSPLWHRCSHVLDHCIAQGLL